MINRKFRIFSVELTGKHIIVAVVVLIALLALGLLQAVAGSVYVLFVPGFFMTLALFPDNREIDKLERFIISIALSVAIVPIVIMMLNIWFGLLIRITTIFLYIAAISLFSLCIFFYRTKKYKEGVASLIAAELSVLFVVYLSDITVRIRYLLAAALIAVGLLLFYNFYRNRKSPDETGYNYAPKETMPKKRVKEIRVKR